MHDEAERVPRLDVEQEIGRLPELDPVQAHGQTKSAAAERDPMPPCCLTGGTLRKRHPSVTSGTNRHGTAAKSAAPSGVWT